MSLQSTYQSRKALLVENLETMGVTGYDETDGLTTLINAVLEIGPTPPTPTPASLDLSLTAGKQILSYADVGSGTEYATFTATVLDQNDDPLPGVSVSIYKDNVLWYTAETGAGGTISKTYDSEGVGDVSFHAVCGSFVTERFALQDCRDYQAMTDNNKQSRWTIPSAVTSSSIFGYSSNGWKFGNASSYSVISLNNNLSIPCVIEFYISSIGNSSNYQPTVVLKDGSTTIITLNGRAVNNTTFMGDNINISTNGSTLVRIELNTNEQKLYFNDVLKSTKTKALPSTSPLEFHTGSNRWIEIKDFKIKPL